MPDFDIAVLGGGPAGLHAAWKAALLHRRCILFDKGRRHSRIYWSPRVDNIPGRYPVSGRDLVDQGHADIAAYEKEYGTSFVTVHEDTTVTSIQRTHDGFSLHADGEADTVEVTAAVLVVATGCIDRQPKLAEFRRRDIEAVLPYANKGLADYCLLCDGHTVQHKRVAVIGCSPGVRGIAKSLKRNFGADAVLVPYCDRVDTDGPGEAAGQGDGGSPDIRDPMAAWEKVEQEMATWGIPIVYGGIKEFTGIKEGRFGIVFDDGRTELFDKAWISMGWYKVNNEPAVQIGGATDQDGFVLTDDDGRILDGHGKPIQGAYAVGDIRSGSWKQIPIAWGEAEAAVIDAFVQH